MHKLIKYEIKDNFKSFIGTFITMIILNLVLYFKLGDWRNESVFILTTLVNAAAFTVVLLFSIGAFSKELYKNRGYLTFTLPIKGSEILVSKLLTTIFWFIIASIIAFIFQYSVLKSIIETEILMHIGKYFNFITIMSMIVIGIYSIASLFIIIYFSITISKMTFKDKKVGKVLGFVVFLLINFIINIVDVLLMKVFPQSFNLNIEVLDKVNIWADKNTAITALADFNIATTLFGGLIFVCFFILTSYFLNNKIEL
ncbi:MAG: hypothetical protein FH751_06325 [Firmicutes bacterium]|nr:hypothetical protein [Bacillota bacterium]